ncbi:MAG: alpha/beta fold hydrolase [Bacteroidota bacterium]
MVHRQYIHPFPTKASRIPLLDLAKSLKGSSDWYQEQWRQLSKLESKDWLILWGIQDEFLSMDYYDQWTRRFPNAASHKFDCGHFV